MSIFDIVQYTIHTLARRKIRSILTLVAMAIGTLAVILLTSLGEGARIYVNQEFQSLGSNLVIVMPGRSETTGAAPPLLGETPRDLTLRDALSLKKHRSVKSVAPVCFGAAPISFNNLEREVSILGTTAEMYDIRQLALAKGQFLPSVDPELSQAVCVLGSGIAKELFVGKPALGSWIRIRDQRFRVLGILDSKGRSLGLDLHETVLIPVASSLSLFNTESLFRILVQARSESECENVKAFIKRQIKIRHEGEEDITVITQDGVLAAFNKIIRALTLGVGFIATISLAVAGLLIMNVLLISVSERKTEIGLLKAIGAPERQIISLFIVEGVTLSLLGCGVGIVSGCSLVAILGAIFPQFPFKIVFWAIIGALLLSFFSGYLFSYLPAKKASKLDTIIALSKR